MFDNRTKIHFPGTQTPTGRTSYETSIILYGISSTGKGKIWKGWVEAGPDNTAIVKVQYGYIDGKQQTSQKNIRTGKNLGKSNATSPMGQAALELDSLANKKRDEGYAEDIANANLVLLPMLAQSFKDNPLKFRYPGYAQPKLNGVRCLAENLGDGKVRYSSRKNKEFKTVDLFNPIIAKRTPKGTILDGELYNHNLPLNQIVSRIKRVLTSRDNIKSDPIEFHVYDTVIANSPFIERYQQLKDWLWDSTSDVVLVDTLKVNNFQELKDYHAFNIENGYEGTMGRNADGMYKDNFRSYDLLKYKDFLEQEFEITGGKDGEGKEEGQVIFTCKTVDGKEFTVRPKGDAATRRAWFNDLENIKGKMLTVRFQEWTEYGIPFHLRGIAIRDYE